MIQHRMVVRKVELADPANGVMPRLHAGERVAGVGMEEFAARELGEKVEMPPRAAEFAVGRELQADRGLLVHDLFDLHVFDLAQIGGRYFALLQFDARRLDLRRTQQAADLVGAERGFGSLHDVNSRELMCRSPRDAQKALEYRGVGFQGGTRRIVNDRAALQYHNTVGEP